MILNFMKNFKNKFKINMQVLLNRILRGNACVGCNTWQIGTLQKKNEKNDSEIQTLINEILEAFDSKITLNLEVCCFRVW